MASDLTTAVIGVAGFASTTFTAWYTTKSAERRGRQEAEQRLRAEARARLYPDRVKAYLTFLQAIHHSKTLQERAAILISLSPGTPNSRSLTQDASSALIEAMNAIQVIPTVMVPVEVVSSRAVRTAAGNFRDAVARIMMMQTAHAPGDEVVGALATALERAEDEVRSAMEAELDLEA
jgi:hypothetical protein